MNAAALLRRQDQDGLATLTLNSPATYNALTRPMMSALQEVLDAIAFDRSIHAVVLASTGKAFCAGHDPKEMRSDPSEVFQRDLFEQCSRMMLSLRRLPQPVIASVQGVAAAAGLQLVAMCDLAVASETARFAASGINLGLFCSTPAVALSRAVGAKLALEILMTGEPLGAQEAKLHGLVNRVVAPEALEEETTRLAQSILAKSPMALGLGKDFFYRQLDMGLEEALALGADVMTRNMMTEDAQHGFDCFLTKTQPVWVGR
jgi:enoyl-CoA hydratase/carnithine racemase